MKKAALECDDPERLAGNTIGRGRCLSAFYKKTSRP